jgi:hypothetical protein
VFVERQRADHFVIITDEKFSLRTLLLVPLALLTATSKTEISLGNNTAPIVMEVYSDYQCPHCKAFHDEIQPQVVRDFVNTGKVYLIHHDFPLPTFKYSREAALYAIAAARFNKYEVVADTLFARQEYWGANGKVDEVVAGALTPAEMKKARVLIDPQIVRNSSMRSNWATAKIVHAQHFSRAICGSFGAVNTSYPILKRVLDDLLSK